MWTNWPDWAHIEGRFLQLYTGLYCTRWQPCSLLYIVGVGMVWLSYTLSMVWVQGQVGAARRCVAGWSGGVLPGVLGMGKVHASTYFSHGPSRSPGPSRSSRPPRSSGPPEPSGHPGPDSLQLELVLPQRYSTGAYGSIEATFLKYY